MTRALLVSRVALLGAVALAGCDPGGCGGATCPFAEVAFLTVEGTVSRADGSLWAEQYGLQVELLPDKYSLVGVTDQFGRYQFALDLMQDPNPGSETVEIRVSAGFPPIATRMVTARFSREASTRPTTVVDLREEP